MNAGIAGCGRSCQALRSVHAPGAQARQHRRITYLHLSNSWSMSAHEPWVCMMDTSTSRQAEVYPKERCLNAVLVRVSAACRGDHVHHMHVHAPSQGYTRTRTPKYLSAPGCEQSPAGR